MNPDVPVPASRPAPRSPVRVRVRPNRPAAARPDPVPVPFPAAGHPDEFRSGRYADHFHLRRRWGRGDNLLPARSHSGFSHINNPVLNATRGEEEAGGRNRRED